MSSQEQPEATAFSAMDETSVKPDEVPDAPHTEVVEGREMSLPTQGFGQLWRKHYRVWFRSDRSAEEVLEGWREHFDAVWPEDQDFYEPPSGMRAGGVAVARLSLGLPIVAGMRVLETSADSFTLGTMEGHMFAGVIRFSVAKDGEELRAEVNATIRASDPLFEAGMLLGGRQGEDAFWRQTLRRLARRYGEFRRLQQEHELLDSSRKWTNLFNVRHNGALHTPVRIMLSPLQRGSDDDSNGDHRE